MARTLLKSLVARRYLRDVILFNRAYDLAAAEIDASLVGTGPSQEQLVRWLNGRIKTTPRPHHCMVLERMFPGYSITDLLGPAHPPAPAGSGGVDAARERGPWEEDTTNRRQFVLGTTAAAGLMVSALLDEPDRMNATLDTGARRSTDVRSALPAAAVHRRDSLLCGSLVDGARQCDAHR